MLRCVGTSRRRVVARRKTSQLESNSRKARAFGPGAPPQRQQAWAVAVPSWRIWRRPNRSPAAPTPSSPATDLFDLDEIDEATPHRFRFWLTSADDHDRAVAALADLAAAELTLAALVEVDGRV